MTMMVRFTPPARLDVIEAFDWYERRATGLGSAFQAEIDRHVQRISESALQFPVAVRDVRRVVGDSVFVLACFHASRDPRRWEGRA